LTPRAGPASPAPRIAAFDAVRGLAIAAVLLFHAGFAPARGGFLGVDLFFVLSGYLITTLLLGEAESSGRVDLARFWARRAKRLLPALLLLVVVVAVAGQVSADLNQRHRWAVDSLSTVGYAANWRFAFGGHGYFDQGGPPSPLQHAWSLGIEEQFYLVWPLVVVVACRFRRRRLVIGAAAAAGLAISALVAQRLAHGIDVPGRLYYGTDARIHAVLAGALTAVVVAPRGIRRRPRSAGGGGWRVSDAAAMVALAGLVWCWWRVDGRAAWWRGGGFLAYDLAAAVVVAAAAHGRHRAFGRLLDIRPAAALGLISYGVYVWHWPLFLVINHATTGLGGRVLLALRLSAALAAGIVSYRLVERPVRTGYVPARLALAGGVALCLVVLAATWEPLRRPGPSIPGPTGELASGGQHVRVKPNVAAAGGEPTSSSGQPSTERPDLGSTGQSAPPPSSRPTGPLRVSVLGDSVGWSLVSPITGRAAGQGVVLHDDTVLGCGIARGGPFRYFGSVHDQPPGCDDWPKRWKAVMAAEQPDVVVVVVGRWEVMDRMHDGSYQHVGQPPFDRYLRDELRTAIGLVRAEGTPLLWCTAPYYHRGERPDGGSWPEDDATRVDDFNRLLRSVTDHQPGVRILDLNQRLGPGGHYQRSVEGVQARYDGVHVTPTMARRLAPWLLDAVRSSAERR